MAFQQKSNSGALFKNDRNDKSDLTGQIMIECPKCHATLGWWMNAWKKTSQAGLKYLGLALTPKGENATAAQAANDSEDVEF